MGMKLSPEMERKCLELADVKPIPAVSVQPLPDRHSFVLLWPPTVNHYWRHVGAKVLVSKKGREYRKAVADELCKLRLASLGSQRLQVIIRAYPPDARRRDLDNLLKSVLDAICKAGLYDDDCQIDRLIISRCETVENGLLAIDLAAILPKEQA